MSDFDDLTLTINWSDCASSSDIDSPENYIYEIEGLVNLTDFEEINFHIGNFSIIYVDVIRALNEGVSIREMMDHSQKNWTYYENLFDGSEFNQKITRMYDEPIYSENLLILDRLEILPEYRGENLGLKTMNLLIKRFSQGAELVALKAFPLQFESAIKDKLHEGWNLQMGYSKMAKNEKTATSKLYKYYGRLGFQKIKRTQYMVLNLNYKYSSFY